MIQPQGGPGMLDLSWNDLVPSLLQLTLVIAKTILNIAVVLAVGYAGLRLVKKSLVHLEHFIARSGQRTETMPGMAAKRAATLTGILRTLALTMIWAMVIIEVMNLVGVDIRPVLAGAGIVGLAVGFGAQNLIRDFISGFFIILEDQIRLGDVAIINGTGGLVESLSFRTIMLRDFSGVVHIFPNGAITTLSNMTKEWSAFVLDMGVAYKENTDRVADIMQRVGEELRQDPGFRDKFIEPIEIIGVDNFADSAVVLRIRIKTKPLDQWNVGREYRRRLKKAFDDEGVEIPFPHRSLYAGSAGVPLKIQLVPVP
jgi:small-conductance mechanosensitive channel